MSENDADFNGSKSVGFEISCSSMSGVSTRGANGVEEKSCIFEMSYLSMSKVSIRGAIGVGECVESEALIWDSFDLCEAEIDRLAARTEKRLSVLTVVGELNRTDEKLGVLQIEQIHMQSVHWRRVNEYVFMPAQSLCTHLSHASQQIASRSHVTSS